MTLNQDFWNTCVLYTICFNLNETLTLPKPMPTAIPANMGIYIFYFQQKDMSFFDLIPPQKSDYMFIFSGNDNQALTIENTAEKHFPIANY